MSWRILVARARSNETAILVTDKLQRKNDQYADEDLVAPCGHTTIVWWLWWASCLLLNSITKQLYGTPNVIIISLQVDVATQRHSSKKTKLRSAVGGDSVTEATGDLLGLLPVVDQSAIK